MTASLVSGSHPFPRLRWLAPLWLAVYLPLYAWAYGWVNFLFLCNLGVILTAIGLWRPSRLLLSSQALAALGITTVWAIDFFGRLLTGHHPLAVTNYMWDPQYPLVTRLLSLYHLAWPVLLLYCLRRLGYDRRAWAFQAGIAGIVLVVCRLWTDPAKNVNFAFVDPLFHRSFGSAPVHLLIVWIGLAGLLYGLTHWLLRWLFGRVFRTV